MKTKAGIPVGSRSPADWLLETKRYEREGELLQAYDIARQGLAKHPSDLALKHRAVLCLASTQATTQAAELFTKLELDLPNSDLAPLPPSRVTLHVGTIHPQFLGTTMVWWRDIGKTTQILIGHEIGDAGHLETAANLNAQA